MEGGNGATIESAVTLCLKRELTYCVSRTSAWMAPVSGANLTAKPSRNAEASNNLLNAERPSVPLDRGGISRRRNLSRKERKEIFKTSRTSSAPPHLRVRFSGRANVLFA